MVFMVLAIIVDVFDDSEGDLGEIELTDHCVTNCIAISLAVDSNPDRTYHR
jgi:hypothetical protein